MEELLALILSTGTRVVISSEPTLEGKSRDLIVNYVSATHGVAVETWEYANDPMDRAWGAIKSVNYQVISAEDMDILEVQTQRRYGRGIIDDFFVALKTQNLTTNQKLTLFNTLHGVVTLCLAGELRAAKAGAETIGNTALYTPVRKTWLVNRIQQEIDKL
jgi:hypothetical protein